MTESANASINDNLIARWAERLAEAEQRYTTNWDEETRIAYERVLKTFAELVVHNKVPEEA